MVGNKILVLHGNRQTGELLLGRLVKLQNAVAKEFQFVAPDAPFLFADGDDDLEESRHDSNDLESSLRWQRTWWHRRGNVYHGLEESITMMEHLWNDDGGFVGILAFSQGSRFAHIISTLHTVTNGDAFRGLRSVVHVSGYISPMPTNFMTHLEDQWCQYNNNFHFDESIRISLPSLHVMGSTDKLVSIQESKELSDLYSEPMIHIHSGGHHVPVKARDIEQYIMFWRKLQCFDEPAVTCTYPDEEHAQAQIDEVYALSQIFPTFRLLSETEINDPDNADPDDYSQKCRKYAHPICYTILLQPEDEEMQQELWPPKTISLHVKYPPDYPDCPPIISLQHEMNYFEFSSNQSDLLMKKLTLTMNDEQGMPCVMSLVYAARDFFGEGGLAKRPAALQQEEKSVSKDEAIEKELQDQSFASSLQPASGARIEKCRREGWLIALKMMENKSNNSGKGGSWKQFTIGLVGKPSAGKSTFFNAATAFARQRGGIPTTKNNGNEDEDIITLGGAAMAPHPFTTIDPNIGFCFVPTMDGSCPEDDEEGCEFLSKLGIPLGSCHGRVDERRLIPVVLKDVAGLVPGAYEGRGKGNKFLDDLTDADVLIHVLDASGKADSEGNKVLDIINPINDLEWISNEIVAWVFTNVKQKWDSVVRRGRSKLLGLFSGYKQSQSFVEDIFTAVENFVRENDGRDSVFDKLESFDDGDLYRLVSAFVMARFPMGLALNKNDILSSAPFIEEITSKLPIHGCFVAQDLSADKEMRFIRHHILHQSIASTASNFEGSVWRCLQKAFSLRSPVLVFPVSEMQTYAPLPGLNNFATRDPSLPSKGFISCLESAGGTAPSNWDNNKDMYVIQGKNEIKPALRDVILMKPGSTVNDVFLTLKNMKVLEGEFVRAEAASKLGEKPKLVSKLDIVGNGNRILMIMTTKRQK
eukprot:scaffold7554_cov143-Skeletonema_menzelii.AAC.5